MIGIRPGTVAAVALAAGLSACAYSYDPPATAALPPGLGAVAFDAPALGGDPGRRVRYVDMWQTEEYALFQGGGAQAEFVYAAVNPGFEVVLEFSKTIEAAVSAFNHNRGDKTWDEERRTETKFGTTWYKPYRLARTGQTCLGFAVDWQNEAHDIHHAPKRALFGYHCQPPGQGISLDEAESLIQRVAVRGITAPMKPSAQAADAQLPRPTPADQQAALGLAHGQGGESGIATFPHRFARGIRKSANGPLS